MSWSDKRTGSGPTGLRAVGLWFGLLLLLGACGFQPMYGRGGAAGGSTIDDFAAIRIAPLPDRLGQQMHNLLRDRLNPRGQPRSPAYTLAVQLSEVREELGIRKDESATRANLILSADFTLKDHRSQEVLLLGRTSSVNSFNILTNEFATTVAEADARERALRELSDDIRIRLGIYFSQARASAS